MAASYWWGHGIDTDNVCAACLQSLTLNALLLK